MYKKDDGALLVIWETIKGNLIGEVYSNGIERRGYWDNRATFKVTDGDADIYRVREYFGFLSASTFWKRWDNVMIGNCKITFV